MRVWPGTRRSELVEELFGHRIADPYRWLEEADNPEVADWVRQQSAATERYLAELPDRQWFRDTMDAVLHRPRASMPIRRAGHYVVRRNNGSQQQDVWYVAESLAELRRGGRVMLDPNQLSADGTASVEWVTFSPDGRLAAYGVSAGGSDWQTITVITVADSSPVGDASIQTKFSAARWLPDSASYLYLDFPHQGTGTGTQTAALPSGRLTLHRIGTEATADELVLEVSDRPRVFIGAEITDDERFAVVSITEGSDARNRLWLYPLLTDGAVSCLGDPLVIMDEPVAELTLVGLVGPRLLLQTDLEAPRGRVVSVDLDALIASGESEFVSVIPEGEQTMISAVLGGDRIMVASLTAAQPELTSYTLAGALVDRLKIIGGAVVGLDAEFGHAECFTGLSSVTAPTTAYRIDTATSTVERLDDLVPPGAGFTPPEVIMESRSARSPDGTTVPYTVIRAAGVASEEGPTPTLLYGYGGFKIPVLADYRPGWSAWLAAGGVLVLAQLRGGGEYGSAWHDAGRRAVKQNVFDDCIAVAEDLIAAGITTAGQLALHGRSNGGLLVGAVLTQRPDLLAVALPAVGVLDMLRFHRFTVGRAWRSDYGDPEVAEDFEVLLAYSPLHRVVPGTAYPATLIMTGDHDDRVVPLHSHKFAAALQHAQGGSAPVLTRIEIAAGHGAGKSASMIAAEWADLLTFAAHHTGLQPPV